LLLRCRRRRSERSAADGKPVCPTADFRPPSLTSEGERAKIGAGNARKRKKSEKSGKNPERKEKIKERTEKIAENHAKISIKREIFSLQPKSI
jgi:hypothetical protein